MTFGLSLWAFAAKRPALYRWGALFLAHVLRLAGGRKGYVRALPLMRGWFAVRDFPSPQGRTFHELWQARK
jgi:L-lactate dehydrogenase complex protein LldF